MEPLLMDYVFAYGFIAFLFFLVWLFDRLRTRLIKRLYGEERLLDVSSRRHLDWRAPGVFSKPGFSGTINLRRVEARLDRSSRITGRAELSPEWDGPWRVLIQEGGDPKISDDCPPKLRDFLGLDPVTRCLADAAARAQQLEVRDGHLHFETLYASEQIADSNIDAILKAAELLSERQAVLDRLDREAVAEAQAEQAAPAEATQPAETVEASTW